MMNYGQFCPIAKAAEIVAERWTPLVLHELLAGSTRFTDIRRGVPLMSQTLLSTRLKELERVGIVERRDGPRAGEWHLTEAGRALAPVIQQLGEWGLRYAQIPLRETDLDVTVMMWNMKRRVDPNVFSARRTIIQFDFTDMPEKSSAVVVGERRWRSRSLRVRSRLSSRRFRNDRYAHDDSHLVWSTDLGCRGSVWQG